MEGASADEVAQKLRKMGYVPTQVKEAFPGISLEGFGERLRGIRAEDLILFNLHLANMIDAGLTILSSLSTITRQIENKKLKEVIEDVRRSVEGGSSFSDALAKHPAVFSKLFVQTVKSGEVSGRLNVVLNRLAVYVQQQHDLRQNIQNALFYPALLIAAGISVVILIVVFVMPQFVSIFTEAKVALPLPTVILYEFGVGLKRFWYLIPMIIAVGVMAAKAYGRTPGGRLRLDQGKLHLPVIGPLVRKVVVSRFSRTLATLLGSGVPVLQSLDIVKEVVGNEVIARVIKNVRDSVEGGERIAQALKVSEEFPPDTVQMISVGEETGRLDALLNKNADFYDTSIGYSIKKLTALIEPLFITILGGMVGFIMASMLLPIFDMIKTIKH